MRAPRFYFGSGSLASQTGAETGGTITLDKPQSHYLQNVLRRRIDDPLILFDGQGHQQKATVVAATKSAVTVRLDHAPERAPAPPVSVTVGLALAKGDRIDWAIQKLTELGVGTIQLLNTAHVDAPLKGDRVGKRLARWQAIAVSACEQSGNNWLPTILAPVALPEWLTAYAGAVEPATSNQHTQIGWVLDPSGTVPARHPTESRAAPSALCLLSGPEGGLSELEVTAAADAGFDRIRLGPRIFRAETAPVVALSLVQWLYGDFAGPD